MRLYAALVLVLLAACVPPRRKVSGNIVQDVHFEGNSGPFGGHSAYTLREQIDTSSSPFLLRMPVVNWLITPSQLDNNRLIPDGYRIEIWYANHGWFDAHFDGWRIDEVVPATPRRAGIVDVTGLVTPGPRSGYREFDVVDAESGSPPQGAAANAAKIVLRTDSIHQDRDFYSYDLVVGTRQMLLDQLRDTGYAHATVGLKIEAFPEERVVDVHYLTTTGPVVRLGAITVQGQDLVKERIILDALDLHEGDAYRRTDLRAAQRRVYDLGLFSVVNVKPDLENPDPKIAPVTVDIAEAKFRTIRIGGGLDFESGNVRPNLQATYRNVFLFHRVLRLDLRAQIGVQQSVLGSQGTFPVYLYSATFSTPRAFGSTRFGLRGSVSYAQDLFDDTLPYTNPKAEAALTWRARINSPEVLVSIGPHVEEKRFDFELSGPEKLAAQAVFGEGFTNTYRLTTIDGSVTIDTRDLDDRLAPKRGTYAVIGARQAVRLRPNDPFYTQFSMDYRRWMTVVLPQGLEKPDEDARVGLRRPAATIVRQFVPTGLAGRFSVQHQINLDPDTKLPFPERRMLGGPTNLRGFFSDDVGPYDCLCLSKPSEAGDGFSATPHAGSDVKPTYIPRGGSTSVLMSAEWRKQTEIGIGGVLFVDAGLLGNGFADTLQLNKLRVGYGAGARYLTSIGVLRIDLAFRPLYPEDWGPESYIDCDASDRIPRAFDMLSLPDPRGHFIFNSLPYGDTRDLGVRKVPFAVGLYVGFGEAI